MNVDLATIFLPKRERLLLAMMFLGLAREGDVVPPPIGFGSGSRPPVEDAERILDALAGEGLISWGSYVGWLDESGNKPGRCLTASGAAAMARLYSDLKTLPVQALIFLRALHSIVRRDCTSEVERFELGKKVGFDDDTSTAVMLYLIEHGLATEPRLSGGVHITAGGIEVAESEQLVLDDKHRRDNHGGTVHMKNESIINNYGTMTNTAVQQGTGHSANFATGPEISDALTAIFQELTRSRDAMQLPQQSEDFIRAQVDVLKGQRESEHLNVGIVRYCLEGIKKFLGTAANAAAAAGGSLLIERLLGRLPMV